MAVELPSTCYPLPVLCKFDFRPSEVSRLLLDLEGSDSVDPSGFFFLFFWETASVLAPKLSLIFRILLSRGVFPRQCRRAVITPIPKGPLSSLVSGYRPISLTPILSKIYERLISTRLSCFMERSGLFPSHQYAYRKGVCTCYALLDIVCAGQRKLDGDRKLICSSPVEFYSASFDRVSHRGLLFKFQDAGIGGLILAGDFLSERT